MDQQATSQIIGREFVRQYYTVLHETPLDMHRFYTEKSSYLHGGDEQAGYELPPVCGQKDIYEKIKSLNFNSCHAKIRQVDSHMSVENSVVIQVSGELSNNGERMRRFMQSFVLVQQSEKNYYVHNDIFRYQDQVFSSDLCLSGRHSQPQHQNYQQREQQTSASLRSSRERLDTGRSSVNEKLTTTRGCSASGGLEAAAASFEDEETAEAEEYVASSCCSPTNAFTPVADDLPRSNGRVHLNLTLGSVEGEELNSGEYTAPSESSVETFNQNVGSVRSPSPDKTAAVKHVQVAGKPVQAPGKYTSYKAPPPSLTKCSNLQRQIDTPPKVMSWAARASANSGNYRASYQRSNDCDGMTPAEAKSNQTQRDESHVNERVQQSQHQNQQQNQQSTFNRVPDNQQLFVGNIPLNSSELALKKFFERFGEILSVKLNSKTKSNSQGVFAFVSFVNADDVLKVLQSTPLKFEGQLLNIEQKKENSKKFNSNKNGNKPNNTNKTTNGPKVNNGNNGKLSNGTNPTARPNARNKARTFNQRPKNGQLITAGGRQ